MLKELPTHWFERADNNPDEDFYIAPRLVAHIDPETISALTAFYRVFIPAHSNVLDLMSSWISHLPLDLVLGRVSGRFTMSNVCTTVLNNQVAGNPDDYCNMDEKLVFDLGLCY